jgi:hypothetical protein
MEPAVLVLIALFAVAVGRAICVPLPLMRSTVYEPNGGEQVDTALSLHSLYLDADGRSSPHPEMVPSCEDEQAGQFPPSSSRSSPPERKRPRKSTEQRKEQARKWYSERNYRKSRMGMDRKESYRLEDYKMIVPPEYEGMTRAQRNLLRKHWLGLRTKETIPEKYHHLNAIHLKIAYELRRESKLHGGAMMSLDESLYEAEQLDDLDDADQISALIHRETDLSSREQFSASKASSSNTEQNKTKHSSLGFSFPTRERSQTFAVLDQDSQLNKD